MALTWSLNIPRFGDAAQLSKWLREQLAKCNDDAFSQGFADHCPVPGIEAAAYLHRTLNVAGEKLLVGIRFKGGNVTQPFVDLMAWTGAPSPVWTGAIEETFSPFKPRAIRFCLSPQTVPPWPGVVDQYVFAGQAKGAAHEWVTLARDLSWFPEFRSSFAEWRKTSILGEEVLPADLDQLQVCMNEGHLVVATKDGVVLGVAGCKWHAERALAGWSIVEEYVVPAARRRGLGAALQRGLMRCLPAGDLVWGTIHGKNIASQATAARCGREAVETWWFTTLGVDTLRVP